MRLQVVPLGLVAWGCSSPAVGIEPPASCGFRAPEERFVEMSPGLWGRTFPVFEVDPCLLVQARVELSKSSISPSAISQLTECNRCEETLFLDVLTSGEDCWSDEECLSEPGISELGVVDALGLEYPLGCGGDCGFGDDRGGLPTYQPRRVPIPPQGRVELRHSSNLNALRAADGHLERAKAKGPVPDVAQELDVRLYWPLPRYEAQPSLTTSKSAAVLCRSKGWEFTAVPSNLVHEYLDAGRLGAFVDLYATQELGALRLPTEVVSYLLGLELLSCSR